LGVEKLLGVLPFVKGFALIEPLVALEADQGPFQRLGHRSGEVGFPDSGRALDENRLAHPVG
jgi:hypothetical protein